MRSTKLDSLLVMLALGGLACDGPSRTPEPSAQGSTPRASAPDHEPASEAAEPPTTSEAAAEGDTPASAKSLLPLVRARHNEDLPDAETLARHPDADEGLRWLATNGSPLSVRARALNLLRHYPDDDTRTLLDQAAKSGRRASLRAAALRGLAGFAGTPDEALQTLYSDSLRDDDPRVVEAAASVMASEAALRPALERATSDRELSNENRARIQNALRKSVNN